MALLTKKGSDALLKRIFESGGLTPDMEKDIQRLKDDFDEREGILKKYGEDYDGELEEYDFKEKTGVDSSNIDEYKAKYEDMKKRYIDRFFNGNVGEAEKAIEQQKNDVRQDEKNLQDEKENDITIDELLEKKEEK